MTGWTRLVLEGCARMLRRCHAQFALAQGVQVVAHAGDPWRTGLRLVLGTEQFNPKR